MTGLGEIAAFVTALLWSGSSIMFTNATVRVGTIQVNITRLLLALLYLGVSILVLGLDLRLSANQWWNLALSGITGLVFGDTFLFRAFKENGARVSMLVMSLVPAMSALLAFVVLGESLPVLAVVGIAVTMAGIAVVVLERAEHPATRQAVRPSGYVYALLGAVGQAVALIFAKAAFNEAPIHGFVATFVRILVSVVLLLPPMILLRRYPNPFRVFQADRKALWYTVGGSIAGPFLGITASLVAIAHTKVGIAATIMAMPPVLMLPLVRSVYREHLTWRSIVGAIVAVAGVAILVLR
jgi:drug/metabolite transporter (DMT)-like permease